MTLYLYVVGAVLFRLIPHPWNATPLGAMFLFSGATFKSKKMSLLVPLVALLVSDYAVDLILYHGNYAWFSPVTWTGFLLVGLLGWTLRGKFNWLKIGGASVAGSTLFFLFTNFGWWWGSTNLYPHNFAGITACYAAGLPFYGNALVGDLAFSALMFGTYHWVIQRRMRAVQAGAH